MTTKLVESLGIAVSTPPLDTTGAAVTGDRFNLKFYGKISFILIQGSWAGGTPAVTLQQHDAVTAGNSKALGFTKYWTDVALTGGTKAEVAVVSDTYNLTTTNNTFNVIEVDAEKLDTDNDFVYASLNVASPGANADLICVVAILGDPRYSGDPAVHLPDPLA